MPAGSSRITRTRAFSIAAFDTRIAQISWPRGIDRTRSYSQPRAPAAAPRPVRLKNPANAAEHNERNNSSRICSLPRETRPRLAERAKLPLTKKLKPVRRAAFIFPPLYYIPIQLPAAFPSSSSARVAQRPATKRGASSRGSRPRKLPSSGSRLTPRKLDRNSSSFHASRGVLYLASLPIANISPRLSAARIYARAEACRGDKSFRFDAKTYVTAATLSAN